MRGSTAPTYIRRYFALALLHTLGDTAATTKGLQSTFTAKAGCKIHPCPHIQSNVIYTLNTIIFVPQLLRPQISSFGHLVRDHDNLTTSLSHSSQTVPTILRHSGIFPNTHAVSLILSFGVPLPHRMLSQHELQFLGNPVHYKLSSG